VSTRPLDIHLIAIGGTGMAPLACLLKAQGHRVRGSDGPLYPPMSTLLSEAEIEPLLGFEPRHLEPRPDLVVVGNAVPRDNPEAQETERLGIPRISMPEALARFFLQDRKPLVVAGTHGKTTTTSLATWVYSDCGRDPGFLVGGIPQNLGHSFRQGTGERFIIEGDEYNAAYFDRGPKFLHYRPDTVLLTSVEYDHADLYPDPQSLIAAYEELIAIVPQNGLLVACGDSPEVRQVVDRASCRVLFYGLGDDNDVHPEDPAIFEPNGTRFRVADPEAGVVEIHLPMAGEHNLANCLAVWAAARFDGLGGEQIAEAVALFKGIKRRLEVLGTRQGITVIDDFAHHPTAVGKTLVALRQRYPGRRLVTLFEPRSLTAGRSIFFADYLDALALADLVFLAPVFHAGRLAPEERLDLSRLVESLAHRGIGASARHSVDDLLCAAVEEVRPGDVVVTMSSGDFGGLPARLLAALSWP
jgi:UDP-N-acetylmuramate: L-alanyl-gamma-D-glutamyl-meso-diaminopimelate ligase